MNIEIKKSIKPINYFDAINFLEKRLEDLHKNIDKELIWILEHDEIFTAGTSYKESEVLDNSIDLIKENFNPNLSIEGILLTMADKRNSLSSLVEKDVRDHFGETVYKTTIPRNVRISEAPSHGKPAILYDVNSSGSLAYIGLAREILEKQGLTNE